MVTMAVDATILDRDFTLEKRPMNGVGVDGDDGNSNTSGLD